MKEFYIKSVGVIGPGLEDWDVALPILRGSEVYSYREMVNVKPSIMPKSLMRRATRHVRFAIESASQAIANHIEELDTVSCVFASSDNDGETTHEICTEVISEVPYVSPMKFHNSVSNAAVGNFCISVGKEMPSVSISAYNGTFSMALIESISQLMTDSENVLMVVNETLCDEPLYSLRPGLTDFSVAFLISSSKPDNPMLTFTLSIDDVQSPTKMEDLNLECIREDNQAAFSLPVLEAIATQQETSIEIPYTNRHSVFMHLI